jgi:CRISPR system Cascade subunit CasC
MEMDFFTAVDDLKPDDEPGAGMMGTVEFNSSCFYRYALIDTAQLAENLGGDEALARAAVEAFLRSSIAAIPSARQNSMAAQNPPSFIFAVVRNGSAPWSLVNAFEKPVRATETKGLVGQSVEALVAYWDELAKMYGEEGIVAKSLTALGDADLGGLKAAKGANVEGVIATVMAALTGGGAA